MTKSQSGSVVGKVSPQESEGRNMGEVKIQHLETKVTPHESSSLTDNITKADHIYDQRHLEIMKSMEQSRLKDLTITNQTKRPRSKYLEYDEWMHQTNGNYNFLSKE